MNSFWPQKQQINCTCFNVVPKTDRKIFRSESYYSSSQPKKQQKQHSIKSQNEQNKSKKKSLKKQKTFSPVPSQKYIKQKQESNKQSNSQIPSNINNQSKKIQKTIVFDYFQPQKVQCPKSQRGKQNHSYRLGRGPSHITLEPINFEGEKVFEISKNRSSLYFEQIISKQLVRQPNRMSSYKQPGQQTHIKYHHQSSILNSTNINHTTLNNNNSHNTNNNHNSHNNNIQSHHLLNTSSHHINQPAPHLYSQSTSTQIYQKHNQPYQISNKQSPGLSSLIPNLQRLSLNIQLQKIDKRISSSQIPIKSLTHRNSPLTARQKQREFTFNHNNNNNIANSTHQNHRHRMQARQIQSEDDGNQISSDQISEVVGRGWDGLTEQRLEIQQLDKLNQRQTYNAETMVTHQSNIQTSEIKTFTDYSNSFISPKSQKNNMLPFGAVHKYGMTGLSYQNIDDLGRKKGSCSKINFEGQY